MSHSIIPPSSAAIWGSTEGCTGWVKMVDQYPDPEDNVSGLEGSASHNLASAMVKNHTAPLLREVAVGSVDAETGVVIDDEMYDCAELYADYVIEIMHKTRIYGGDNFGNEFRIDCPDIHAQSFGTVDQFIFDDKAGVIYLIDYKFGHGYVNEYYNWQLINYLSGLVTRFNINGAMDSHIDVEFTIVQPRYYSDKGPIRTWKTNVAALRGHFNTLHNNAHKALSEDAELYTGPHCKNCSARHACPAANMAGMQLYESSMQPIPSELSLQQLGTQLNLVTRAVEQLKLLETGYLEQAKNICKSGVTLPGWNIKDTYSRQSWNKPAKEVITMGKLMGVDVVKPDQLITPKQAMSKGLDESIVREYSSSKHTGIKLVPDNENKAKRIFEND